MSPTESLASARPSMSRLVATVLAGWACVALPIAASGALVHLPRPAIPLVIASVPIAAIVTYRRSEALRAWVKTADLRLPILYHLIRIVFGLAFLRLFADGRLPAEFALRAGYGDIVAGGLAPVAAFAALRLTPARRAIVLGWNVIALGDILLVIATAQKLLILDGDAQMLGMLSSFPYSTLPVFVVPMVVLTHLLVFARLRAS
jgi:hypothetical protein